VEVETPVPELGSGFSCIQWKFIGYWKFRAQARSDLKSQGQPNEEHMIAAIIFLPPTRIHMLPPYLPSFLLNDIRSVVCDIGNLRKACPG
jgi:hypothetical protein